MRKSISYLLTAVLMFSVAGAVVAQENPQKPGKWQIKIETEMPGMPFKMPPVTTEVCLTEEDVKDPQKAVPNDPKSDCKVGDYKIDGKTVSWTMECPKQNMKGDGAITFSDESYSGVMNMQMGEQAMKMKYTGKWLGTCKK